MIKSALLCLALTIYHESRGEPLAGQIAVGEVVVNRANERNLSICEVVYEPKQFSWVKQQKGKPLPSDAKLEQSLNVAQQILDNPQAFNYSNGSTNFNIASIGAHGKKHIKIGNHVFYKI